MASDHPTKPPSLFDNFPTEKRCFRCKQVKPLTEFHNDKSRLTTGRLTAQGGKCAICGTTQNVGNLKRLAIDHDAASGFIRGLLCNPENRGIGLFCHDPQTVRHAIQYLQAGI